jgi:hypothetical protein
MFWCSSWFYDSYAAYLTTISSPPNLDTQASMHAFTVARTRTSHSNPRHLSCQFCICCIVFSIVRPTAATLSPCMSADFTSDRPMCPVAPKMSHVFWIGGLVSDGGSVEEGRCSFGLLARRELGERTAGELAIGVSRLRARGSHGRAVGHYQRRWGVKVNGLCSLVLMKSRGRRGIGRMHGLESCTDSVVLALIFKVLLFN